ncbi:MAG: hypothetical protein DESF_01397 [Desulfovibrio sp.]
MKVTDSEYQEHVIFSELSGYAKFYERLSFSVFSWITLGTHPIINIDTYIFSSLRGTLESIQLLLANGRINDAWTLMRKYHDSIIINIYSGLYLKNNFRIENMIVEQIDGWLKGTSKLPEFRVMMQYIRSMPELCELKKLLFEHDSRYKDLRDRGNNNIHYNFYANILLNDNEIFLKNRIKILNRFLLDMRDLFTLHFSYIFSIHENYMISSDYVDHLDCGTNPPENSQYWVAPFVKEVFDKTITKHRPDVAAFMRKTTSMMLE